MRKNNFKVNFLFFVFLFINFQKPIFSENMILSNCKSLKNSFIKNEYILNFEKSLMIRNFIYDKKTFKKLKLTDLSIKKINTIEKFIYEDENLIFTDKVGYPQFYTQLVFEKNNPKINIKTVINNEESLMELSTCEKVIIFKKES
jgi:hypothetical protein|tara:strand:+ start:467 stop:901 length:435 start_codon:yes stop_codon:yes gene_type:complete